MKVLVALDSFKGSLSSLEAGLAVKNGILKADKNARIEIMQLADGGEGTCKALADALGGKMQTVRVSSPKIGVSTNAEYAVCQSTAIIEIAAAAGITLVDGADRNALYTTSFGVGEMIADAIKKGCRDFIIGLGGSATNDCGIGMLKALGFEFLDNLGSPVTPNGNGIRDIAEIKCENKLKELSDCSFTVACDVTNPLWGENGCSKIFAPQKGADQKAVRDMDGWIKGFSALANKKFGTDFDIKNGAGAAGGLGYAFFTFLNAKMQSGATLVLEKLGAEQKIAECDIVVTGEGRMDGQSVFGKAPITLAKLAKAQNKKVLAFCGCVGDGAENCNKYIDGIFTILNEVVPIEKALDKGYAAKNLTRTAAQVFNIIK